MRMGLFLLNEYSEISTPIIPNGGAGGKRKGALRTTIVLKMFCWCRGGYSLRLFYLMPVAQTFQIGLVVALQAFIPGVQCQRPA